MTTRLNLATLALLTALSSIGVAGSTSAPTDPHQSDRAERKVRAERQKQALQAASEHLKLALEARKKALYPQAAYQLRRALTRSRSGVSGAGTVRNLMETRHAGWWKRRPTSKPSSATIASHDKKAARLLEQDREARLRIALDAAAAGMVETALLEVTKLCAEVGEPLAVKNGKLRLLGQNVPAEISARVWDGSVQISGGRYVQEEFLRALYGSSPEEKDLMLYEHADEHVIVRSQRSLDEAREFHTLASAFLPFLEAEMAATSNHRVSLFLFADRTHYEAYLSATKQAGYRQISGLADTARRTAIVVMDDFLDPASAKGFVLHELTHLFMYDVSFTPMPSWYSEGLAEIYGGPGTFAWDGGKLTVGGRLSSERIRELLGSSLRRGIRGMLAEDALDVWHIGNPEEVRTFYTEAWALLTFLRNHAGKSEAQQLLEWEITCRGQGLERSYVVEQDGSYTYSARPAIELFEQLFGDDINDLDLAFEEWLREYPD